MNRHARGGQSSIHFCWGSAQLLCRCQSGHRGRQVREQNCQAAPTQKVMSADAGVEPCDVDESTFVPEPATPAFQQVHQLMNSGAFTFAISTMHQAFNAKTRATTVRNRSPRKSTRRERKKAHPER